MKIVFLTRRFYPNIGGVEKHILEISKILIEMGHNITVVTENEGNLQLNIDEYKKITIYRIPSLSNGKLKKYKIWKWLFKNRNILKDADIIHCHDVFFWYLPFRFIYYSKKVYTTFHGYENYPIKLKEIVVRKISELLSNGNICIGDFIKYWYFTNPTKVLYGGVNSVNKLMTPTKSSAVFFGRLNDQTGIMIYANAIKYIRQKYPSFTLLVLGEGKYKKNIEAIKGITVIPPSSEIKMYLSEYRFIFVSSYLSILESLMNKRIVFSVYDNPLKKDYLLKSIFTESIFISNKSSMLAEQVISCLKDDSVEKDRIEKGYKLARNFTWKYVTNDYLDLWNI